MKIKLSLTSENRFGRPKLRCAIDENAPFFDGPCQDIIESDFMISPGSHELVITHYGKLDSEQILDAHGRILVDKHVEILTLAIDDIDFMIEELRQAHFYPVYNPAYYDDCIAQGGPPPSSISPNLYLGHNGTWKLSFGYPFVDYIIYLRNQTGYRLDDTIFRSDTQLLQDAKQWFLAAPDIVWKI